MFQCKPSHASCVYVVCVCTHVCVHVVCICAVCVCVCVVKLTVCFSLTIPCSLTTFGCLNWPMMAPSCRNLTLSDSWADDLRVLMATSILALGDCHIPRLTVPNCPDPRHSVALKHSTE